MSLSPPPYRDIPLHPRSSQNGVGFSSILRCDRRLLWPTPARHRGHNFHPKAGLVSLHPLPRVHPVHIGRRLPLNLLSSVLQSALISVHPSRLSIDQR